MIERRWWGAIRSAGLACGLLAGFGCSSSFDVAFDEFPTTPPEYMLGGQTGSLVPGCGVAPLSAAGRSVPAGDALAILYAQDCPEQAVAEQLALLGVGADAVQLELVPLEGAGVFLVRADQSLSGGDYQLALGSGSSSDVRVDADAADLPLRLGALSLLPPEGECPDRLRFELTLDAAALAYAPLSRFDVSIDGGAEQLWVDYGALPIESSALGNRGVLELPRCGSAGCLEGGLHRLKLRVQVAGESLEPAPLELEFEVQCPAPSLEQRDSDTAGSCTVAPAARVHTLDAVLGLFSCWLGSALRRRRRRNADPPFRGA
jgi:hypothetical protein